MFKSSESEFELYILKNKLIIGALFILYYMISVTEPRYSLRSRRMN